MVNARSARKSATTPSGRYERVPNLQVHIVGLTLLVCGIGIFSSGMVGALRDQSHIGTLAATGAGVGVIGLILWMATTTPTKFSLLDVFTTVTSAWVAMAVCGAIPYLVTSTLATIDLALFESISGFTTTGATVLRPIEAASDGILFWRAITQWIGGMGVIVLVVAVLPQVGSGGMNLLAAEAPGPTGERLTPRVAQTARHLWGVYAGFTVILAIAYMLAGMSLYDGVAHSFTTVSTGGFSPYNRSLAHFESAAIEWIAIVSMFLAGTSFTLMYRAIRGRPGPLLKSVELRLYLTVVLGATSLVYLTADAGSDITALRQSMFAVVAVTSTTGFATADFALWSDAAQSVLLVLMPLGAMAGSTAGGVKMVRILAIASHAHRETLRHLHPRLVRPIRIGGVILDDQVGNKVLGFFVLALATFGGGALFVAMTGSDIITSFSASATLLGNVGPGLGDVGPTEDFLNISRVARAVGMVSMLLGRLEIYPILLALAALPLSGARRLMSRVVRSNQDG